MFAYEIGEKWKVGQKEFDNGIVVLVKPKYSNRDRGEAYIDDVAIGSILVHLNPVTGAYQIVRRNLNAGNEAEDGVFKHEKDDGRHGSQAAEESPGGSIQ